MTDLQAYKILLNKTINDLDNKNDILNQIITNFNTQLVQKKYLPNLPNKIDDNNINNINNNFNNYKNEIKKINEYNHNLIIKSVINNLYQFENYLNYIIFGINNNLEKANNPQNNNDDINKVINIYINYQKIFILEIQKINIENEIQILDNNNNIFIQIRQDLEKAQKKINNNII